MKIEKVAIDRIKPYKNNPRKNEKSINFVKKSIEEFGFRVPILIDNDNEIIAGHVRFFAAKKLQLAEIPCIYVEGLTKDQIKAYRIADNAAGMNSEFDLSLLKIELEQLDMFDMEQFGLDFNIEDFANAETKVCEQLFRGEGERLSFDVKKEQAEVIRYCLFLVKDDIKETFGNDNENGNALYEIVKQWAAHKGVEL